MPTLQALTRQGGLSARGSMRAGDLGNLDTEPDDLASCQRRRDRFTNLAWLAGPRRLIGAWATPLGSGRNPANRVGFNLRVGRDESVHLPQSRLGLSAS